MLPNLAMVVTSVSADDEEDDTFDDSNTVEG